MFLQCSQSSFRDVFALLGSFFPCDGDLQEEEDDEEEEEEEARFGAGFGGLGAAVAATDEAGSRACLIGGALPCAAPSQGRALAALTSVARDSELVLISQWEFLIS